MTDTVYHVYDKNNKVVAHTHSKISLAEKLLNDEIDLVDQEVIACEYNKEEEASY